MGELYKFSDGGEKRKGNPPNYIFYMICMLSMSHHDLKAVNKLFHYFLWVLQIYNCISPFKGTVLKLCFEVMIQKFVKNVKKRR